MGHKLPHCRYLLSRTVNAVMCPLVWPLSSHVWQATKGVVKAVRVDGYYYHPKTAFSGTKLDFEAARIVSPRIEARCKGFPSQHMVEFSDKVRHSSSEVCCKVHQRIHDANLSRRWNL